MRRMSFSATIPAMHARTKTVTRRHPDTWKNLEQGDRVLAIEKGMGLAKGEKQVPISVIEVVSNEIVTLGMILAPGEAAKEGFKSVHEFKDVWARMGNGWRAEDPVRRIEFRHIHLEATA